MRRARHRRRRRWILGSIAAALLTTIVVVHLYLNSWLLDYVNKVLGDIPGYPGSAESIEIDLYRGAYKINNLVINKKSGHIPTPFVSIDETDLSIEWRSLFHGRIVSEATLTRPVINYAVKENTKQTGVEVDWTKPIKDLMPIDINHVRIKDGSITFKDFSSTPQVNLYMHDIEGAVYNLRNVEDDKDSMPSTLKIQGRSIGHGNLKVTGRLNILKKVPDMDLLVALEKVNMPALNSYSQAYAAFDFKTGEFDLYSHLMVKNNRVNGYIKPIARHMEVDVLKSENPLQVVWSAAVAAVIELFTNHTKDQFATQAELQGNLDDFGTDFWETLGGILSNAFIEAIGRGFDETNDRELIERKG